MAARLDLADLGPDELDGFEVWDKSAQAPAGSEKKKAAYLTVRKGGTLGLSKAARAMFGPPDAVRIMYDPKRNRIGLMHADPEAEDSYPMPSRYEQVQLSCVKLFRYYGIDTSETRRYYDLEIIEEILVVHLGGESGKSPSGGRRRGRVRL